MQIPQRFKHVWFIDTEYVPTVPFVTPVCLTGYEYYSGETFWLWGDSLGELWGDQLGDMPPYPIGEDSLVIGYNLMAEWQFHLAKKWPLPRYSLDLYFAFRRRTSGLKGWPPRRHRRLVDALEFFSLSGLDAVEKQEMVDRIKRGGPWTAQEQRDIVDYCWSDVLALRKLLPAMAPEIRWSYAIYHSNYAKALARTETVGTPIDVDLAERFQLNREVILDRMIAEIDKDYHLFEGRTFKYDRIAQWAVAENIVWPVTETGRLDLRDETFEDLSNTYPQLKPIRQLRQSLSGMRLHAGAVDKEGERVIGKDGRIRCFLNPFGSSTGRNQPSSSKFVWGMSKWYRNLVKPPEGHGVAILDYKAQEFGMQGAVSGDQNMMTAYQSSDPYLWFAKAGDLIPREASRQTLHEQHALYKMAVLAIGYEIGAESLGLRINRPPLFARHLIGLHHDFFPDYWRWSNRAVDHAMLFGWQSTVFDWIYRLPPDPRPTALRNFPIQSNGAEMMRLAHCLATEGGIQVCAPVHDAFVILASLTILDQEIARMKSFMVEASRVILRGFELSVDVKVIRYPDRYRSPEGQAMWDLVMRLLEEIETEAAVPSVNALSTPVTV
jgi:hypothetical protein